MGREETVEMEMARMRNVEYSAAASCMIIEGFKSDHPGMGGLIQAASEAGAEKGRSLERWPGETYDFFEMSKIADGLGLSEGVSAVAGDAPLPDLGSTALEVGFYAGAMMGYLERNDPAKHAIFRDAYAKIGLSAQRQ